MNTSDLRTLDELEIFLDKADKTDCRPYQISADFFQSRHEIPMLESGLIQWVLTILKRNETSVGFEYDGTDSLMAIMERWATSPAGAVLALSPQGKVVGLDRQTSANFRERLLKKQQSWPDLVLTPSASLICFDKLPKYLPPQLYLDPINRTLADWSDYGGLVEGMMKSVAPHETRIQNQILGRQEAINTIFFELFKNTHDHARTRLDGRDIVDSLRGIVARFYPVESFEGLVKQSEPEQQRRNELEKYLAACVTPHFARVLKSNIRSRNQGAITGFFEISVFDSGPGMASRWLNRDSEEVDVKEQYKALINCFGKGYSSTSTGRRGFGLWNVLEQLRQVKGCIRVRTNRLNVFRQFKLLPNLHVSRFQDGHMIPKEKLYDWRKGYSESPSEYAPVNGTLISVMLPLEAE